MDTHMLESQEELPLTPQIEAFFDHLDRQGLFVEALALLRDHGNPNVPAYYFYLGYIQERLGWTEEAIQSMNRFRSREGCPECNAITLGFMAHIYHNEGMLMEAASEISAALKIMPDDPLLKRTAKEIHDDLNNWFNGITAWLVLFLHKKMWLDSQ